MSDQRHSPLDDEFEARAEAAGRAVRAPAPADGLGRVRAAKRRRTVVQAGAAVAVAALAVGGIVAISGPGGDETLQPAEPPAATTSTPGTQTTNDTSASTATTATAPAATDPQPATETTATTAAPTVNTVEATVVDTAVPTTVEAVVEYREGYTGPTLSDQQSDPISIPLPDGDYWSWSYRADGSSVTFDLVQLLVGQACIDHFDVQEDACASDNGTVFEPSTTITMTADATESSVVWYEPSQIRSFNVPTSEFIRLASGQPPSAGAPDGFQWEAWPVLVTVRDGRAVGAYQRFMS